MPIIRDMTYTHGNTINMDATAVIIMVFAGFGASVWPTESILRLMSRVMPTANGAHATPTASIIGAAQM